MHKPFLTYSQQISKLKNQKKLTINDEANAIEILHNIGYFSLIGGYKNPFINPMTRIYNPGTTFDDIFALYTFDKELREIVFKYLCEVEQHIRESISYAFCSVHGEMQAEYLNPANFDSAHARQPEIDKLIRTLDYIANKDTDHEYIVHQRKVHKNVPLWVAMKVLTFGQISHFYTYLPHSLKAMISKEFVGINEAELGQYLRAFTLFRNVCAHNERLFTFQLGGLDFHDTPLHKKLCIPQKGTQYIYGKKDLFGLVIAMRYLLSKESFISFKKSLTVTISKFTHQSNCISESQLLDMMGFPQNWNNITRYKL